MKRPYLANGVLSAPLFPDSYTAFVDANLVTYLSTLLSTDYCYLVINACEIVKVMGCLAPNVLYIERFAEQRKTYLTGTPIQYFLTPNEIQDAVSEQELNLTQDQAIVTNGNNVSYPEINIIAIGGINISGLPKAMIQDLELAGCGCSEPPEIPINYLQLRIVDTGYRIVDSGEYRAYA